MSVVQLERPSGLGSVALGRCEAATTRVRVLTARWEAQGVTSFELASTEGSDLPHWSPGAHVDVHLPSGTVRQYSLCGEPSDLRRYRIAVLELRDGRGGSVEAHRELRPGAEVRVGAPRHDFGLVEADRYLFVAGGIGITPLLPMIHEVQRRGGQWQLVYGARSAQHFTFGEELVGLDPSRVRLVAADTGGRIDVADVVRGSAGAAVYCCGPTGLMDALAEEMERAGRLDDLHLERFVPAAVGADGGTDGFEVELAASGRVVQVGPEESVLEAVRAAGVEHPSSCEMGICGTCEVKVLAGEVDHRDDLLTPQERADGGTMMICVSRARCSRLTLDI